MLLTWPRNIGLESSYRAVKVFSPSSTLFLVALVHVLLSLSQAMIVYLIAEVSGGVVKSH